MTIIFAFGIWFWWFLWSKKAAIIISILTIIFICLYIKFIDVRAVFTDQIEEIPISIEWREPEIDFALQTTGYPVKPISPLEEGYIVKAYYTNNNANYRVAYEKENDFLRSKAITIIPKWGFLNCQGIPYIGNLISTWGPYKENISSNDINQKNECFLWYLGRNKIIVKAKHLIDSYEVHEIQISDKGFYDITDVMRYYSILMGLFLFVVYLKARFE
jgi:hypothetical protein